jgi:hypothetical protein
LKNEMNSIRVAYRETRCSMNRTGHNRRVKGSTMSVSELRAPRSRRAFLSTAVAVAALCASAKGACEAQDIGVPLWNADAFHADRVAAAILVDRNPFVLNASFFFPRGTEPFVSTRIRIAATSSVVALAVMEDRVYLARKDLKGDDRGLWWLIR